MGDSPHSACVASAILADIMFDPQKTGEDLGTNQLVKDDFLGDIWEDTDAFLPVDWHESSRFTVAGLRNDCSRPDAAIPTGVLVPADFFASPLRAHEVHLAIVIDIYREVRKVISVTTCARTLAQSADFPKLPGGKARVAIPDVARNQIEGAIIIDIDCRGRLAVIITTNGQGIHGDKWLFGSGSDFRCLLAGDRCESDGSGSGDEGNA